MLPKYDDAVEERTVYSSPCELQDKPERGRLSEITVAIYQNEHKHEASDLEWKQVFRRVLNKDTLISCRAKLGVVTEKNNAPATKLGAAH